MPSTVRVEAIEQLYNQGTTGIIPLTNKGRRDARTRLHEATLEYEEARKAVMLEEYARYYRVAIFGSARLPINSREYNFVANLSRALVDASRMDVVTGGGPGAMEAANFGVMEFLSDAKINGRAAKARNIGLPLITLKIAECANQYLHDIRSHLEFSTRLQAFLDMSHSSYNAVGGIGTLLEQLMIVQSRQVGHLEEYPILAHPFWRPLVDVWNDELYHKRKSKGRIPLINQKDLEIIRFSQNIPEIVDIISGNYNSWKKNFHDHTLVLDPFLPI